MSSAPVPMSGSPAQRPGLCHPGRSAERGASWPAARHPPSRLRFRRVPRHVGPGQGRGISGRAGDQAAVGGCDEHPRAAGACGSHTDRLVRAEHPYLPVSVLMRQQPEFRSDRRVGARLSGRRPTAQQSRFGPIDSRPRCIFMHHQTWGECPLLPHCVLPASGMSCAVRAANHRGLTDPSDQVLAGGARPARSWPAPGPVALPSRW